jgi:hypothetical protein
MNAIRIIFLICVVNCNLLISQNAVDFQVYLLGNLADDNFQQNEAYDNYINQIDWENENSAILFLGDDIFTESVSITPELKDYANTSHKRLLNQLKSYKGKVFFIPGISRNNTPELGMINDSMMEEFIIENFLDRGDIYIPDNGCPGPEAKNLSDQVKLVVLDSEWWLEKHDQTNNDCRNQNKFQIIQELKEILDKNDDKYVILAFHHPIIKTDKYFGHVRMGKSFVPLPLLGSIKPFFRATFGNSQNISHPHYEHFRNEIIGAIREYKNVIVCSAHENDLQYFNLENNHLITTGFPSKRYPVKENTYARLDFNQEGGVMLYLMKTNNKTHKIDELSQEIIGPPPNIPAFAEAYTLDENRKEIIADIQYKRGPLHRLIFGGGYRNDWSTPVSFESINLSLESGGLRPIKLGGGKASRSLRLENKSGSQFVLRSVKKDIWRVIPEAFRNSLVQKVVQDQISGSQPYAALAVPPLAEAAGVYHTNPRIVYLANQDMLGDFNNLMPEGLYLFEERPTGDHKDEETVVDSKKVISYSKMLKKIQNSPDHRIRQEQVLRSRLFDIYLGDWDRHDDQWRWASFKEQKEGGKKGDKITFYEPVPRDRDQVFYKFQGFGPWLIKFLLPAMKLHQSFKPKINNVKYLGFQSRHFDRSFLNRMDEKDWVDMAEKMKSNIKDEDIDEAISRLPDTIRSLNKDFYKKSLLTRRDDLPSYASKFYKYLARYVDVLGSDKKELFQITRNPDNTLLVSVFHLNKDGNPDELLYERIFKTKETKEVRLFGLGGKDRFELKGEQKNGPLVRIIGGKGEDQIIDNASRKRAKKGTLVYDSQDGNNFSLGRDTKDKRSDDFLDNRYNREEYYFDLPAGIFFFGYNPNDGLNISSFHIITKYGFRKSPFKAKHKINFNYAHEAEKLDLGYELQLTDVVGEIDLNFKAVVGLPNNVDNFFGLSNDQTFSINDFEELEFFKYSQSKIYIKPALQFNSEHNIHDLKIGPYYEYTNLLGNEDKFIGNQELSKIDPDEFTDKSFVGLDVDYKITKLDNPVYPTLGMSFRVNASYNTDLSNSDHSFTRLKATAVMYNMLWLPKPLVLATKVSAGINVGDFSFYQANYAGFHEGLRAFRQNRFGGKSSFIVSNDLRLKLFKVPNNLVPFSVGVIASYDIGRVWNKNVISDTWHNSYGGGLWLNFLDILPLSFYYLTSNGDEASFIFKTGFGF